MNIYRHITLYTHRYPNYNKTTIIKRQHNLEQENLLNLNCSSRCHHSAHVDERFGYTYVCCLLLQLLFDKKSPLSFKCYLYKPITLIYSLSFPKVWSILLTLVRYKIPLRKTHYLVGAFHTIF